MMTTLLSALLIAVSLAVAPSPSSTTKPHGQVHAALATPAPACGAMQCI